MTRSFAIGGATTGPNAINKQVWHWYSDPFGTSGQTSTGGSANSAPNKNPQLVTGTAAQIAAASQEQNLRMPGQYEDQETKKFYNVNRNYVAQLRRYDSSDPIGLTAGHNTYAYVFNNPISRFDTLGLSAKDVTRILQKYSEILTRLDAEGRRAAPWGNVIANSARMLCDLGFCDPFFGMRPMLCFEQANVVVNELQKLTCLDDKWEFRPATNSDGSHTWAEGRSSNAGDPVLRFDPWYGRSR
jgi:RHS repeat-associated protein